MYAIGNHDPEADLNNTQITNLDITHPFSLTLKSTENLKGNNYYNSIYFNDEKIVNLWAFDSN
jgi:hypothetical protein